MHRKWDAWHISCYKLFHIKFPFLKPIFERRRRKILHLINHVLEEWWKMFSAGFATNNCVMLVLKDILELHCKTPWFHLSKKMELEWGKSLNWKIVVEGNLNFFKQREFRYKFNYWRLQKKMKSLKYCHILILIFRIRT